MDISNESPNKLFNKYDRLSSVSLSSDMRGVGKSFRSRDVEYVPITVFNTLSLISVALVFPLSLNFGIIFAFGFNTAGMRLVDKSKTLSAELKHLCGIKLSTKGFK